MYSHTPNSARQDADFSPMLPSRLQPSPPVRQHSSSVPSTPSQKPHNGIDRHRSPSLNRSLHNVSPRSLNSDSSQATTVPRRQQGGCKYETGMAKARRRVPYSLGPEKLPPEPLKLKKQLRPEDEERLTKDIEELYQRLLPSAESEARREKFVEKLQRILRERWPGYQINVNVFGSTGNNLGTSDSDVDICVTTDCKELSRVCSIAELLAKNGMERVVCVSSAKVPIVKLWDPELQVACDLNVNNPIALENTALIKAYVDIDPRVRPLAMIIKYWAKKRILNDAALGATLSSYTWICLALNFLQTRKPPILPSLQKQDSVKPREIDGVNVAFEKDLSSFNDFGKANTVSLGQTLYQFFRYYAYEFDFEAYVVSVRLGALIPKAEKGWHLLQDNRLCVEEPFNTSRNLANTADDTSMRGIHLELRRAFGLIAEGQLDKCCEQYQYPAEEIKPSEHFVPPQSRPVIPQPPPQANRGGKGSGRGGRNATHLRSNVGARRSSNPLTRQPMTLRNLPFQMTPQELQQQAQHQQYLLHDHLFQQYQFLQLQEQELRMRLNQRQRNMMAQGGFQPTSSGVYANQDEEMDSTSAMAFNAANRGPLSAPLYQNRFPVGSPFLLPTLPVNGVVTNPSSPHLSPVVPETMRVPRRPTVAQSPSGGSLRAQSQPARIFATPAAYHIAQQNAEFNELLSGRRSSTSSASHDASGARTGLSSHSSYGEANRRPAEYVGYYVGQSPSLVGYPQSANISPIPSHAGLAIQNGGLSPGLRSSSPRIISNGVRSVPPAIVPSRQDGPALDPAAAAPAAIRESTRLSNGHVVSPRIRQTLDSSRVDSEDHLTFSTSTSEDLAFDTPSSSDENSQDPREQACDPDASSRMGLQGIAGTYSNHLLTGRLAQMQLGGEAENKRVENGHKPNLTAWKLPRQLSSVQEVRTPSPRLDQVNAKVSSPLTKTGAFEKPALEDAKAKLSVTTELAQADGALAAKPNGTGGAVESTVSPTASSWQTQKKRRNKKKTVKSENDAYAVNAAGGDFLPVDASQRKGG